MSYTLPQVLVFQDFNLQPQITIDPLRAFIFGGHAYLQRYDVAAEKAISSLGAYNSTGLLVDGEYQTVHSWPGRPIGAVIDPGYTRVFIDNALLRYFYDKSGAATIPTRNSIKLAGTYFKDNPIDTDYLRSAGLYDRDVQPGDIVVLRGTDGAAINYSLSTYVKSVSGTPMPAAVSAVAADAGNETIRAKACAVTAVAGNTGVATIGTPAATWADDYDGFADGVLTDTYTIEVIQAQTGTDPTTARLRITSVAGDNVLSYTPNAGVFSGTYHTPIGTRGGYVIFTSESSAGLGFDEVGDKWTVVFTQDYHVAVPVVSDTGTAFTGTRDTTYIVEVVTGGAFGTARIKVTTADGSDYGPSVTVPATPSTAFAIGTKGALIKFAANTENALVYGDRWSFTAVAAAAGNYETLVLGHSLPAGMTHVSEISLYIKKNIEVGEHHVAVPGQYNWTQNDTQINLLADIQAYDVSYTDNGAPVALSVTTDDAVAHSNQVHVQYRAWLPTLAFAVESINDVADLDGQVSGATHPDNPLKFALFCALQNSNGREIRYMAVANPDNTASWTAPLEAIEDRTDVYGLVPLTRNDMVLHACRAHVQAQSNELAGRWRVLWVNLQSTPNAAVLTGAANVLATTADDPDADGTQYTLLSAVTGEFETLSIRPGDVVRYQYTTDAFGAVTYSEYVVDEVVNENTIRLSTGTDSAETIARKIEIWRQLTLTEQAEQIGASAGNWADRRVRAVWPDTFETAGYTVEGFHLCAMLAALVSSVPAHQGLTCLEIFGVDSVPRTTDLFSRTRLNDMASHGTWIVTQDPRSGVVSTRHALTTGEYVDINTREEIVTRNVDSISYYFLGLYAPYIGISNVTPSTIDVLCAETKSGIQYLRTANYSQRLGGQLIDATITDLRASPVFKDRVIVAMSLNIPYALNNIEVHLVV